MPAHRRLVQKCVVVFNGDLVGIMPAPVFCTWQQGYIVESKTFGPVLFFLCVRYKVGTALSLSAFILKGSDSRSGAQ